MHVWVGCGWIVDEMMSILIVFQYNYFKSSFKFENLSKLKTVQGTVPNLPLDIIILPPRMS